MANSSFSKKEKIKAEVLPPPVPEAQAANINFRERIMDLKNNVNEAVAKAGALKKEQKKADAAKEDQDAKDKKAAPGKEGNGDGNLQLAGLLPPAKPPLPL